MPGPRRFFNLLTARLPSPYAGMFLLRSDFSYAIVQTKIRNILNLLYYFTNPCINALDRRPTRRPPACSSRHSSPAKNRRLHAMQRGFASHIHILTTATLGFHREEENSREYTSSWRREKRHCWLLSWRHQLPGCHICSPLPPMRTTTRTCWMFCAQKAA